MIRLCTDNGKGSPFLLNSLPPPYIMIRSVITGPSNARMHAIVEYDSRHAVCGCLGEQGLH